jgi:hypothetical protein
MVGCVYHLSARNSCFQFEIRLSPNSKVNMETNVKSSAPMICSRLEPWAVCVREPVRVRASTRAHLSTTGRLPQRGKGDQKFTNDCDADR